jgi:transcriptional regulator with XRE-family HTH domain
MTATHTPLRQTFGDHLRHWRQHRRLSQLDLADEAAISTRHLSFMETGRAVPSREMVLRLTERLGIPLRERNTLLMAAGYAPMYRERGLDDPALRSAREAVELILKGHEPYPALAVDRHWNLVSYNAPVPRLMAMADPSQLQAPVNVLRLSLHPQGLAPMIANLGQWRQHLFERLRQQIAATADPVLTSLLEELRGYPAPSGPGPAPGGRAPRRGDAFQVEHAARDAETTAPPHLSAVRGLLRARAHARGRAGEWRMCGPTPTCSAPATSAPRAWR